MGDKMKKILLSALIISSAFSGNFGEFMKSQPGYIPYLVI